MYLFTLIDYYYYRYFALYITCYSFIYYTFVTYKAFLVVRGLIKTFMQIFVYLKNYVFILHLNCALHNNPYKKNTPIPISFPVFKTFLNTFCNIVLSSVSDFTSSTVMVHYPFKIGYKQSCKRSRLVNTVIVVSLHCYLWPNILEQDVITFLDWCNTAM